MSKLKYDLNYFLMKFADIGKEEWACNEFIDPAGRKCALGHCNSEVEESDLLFLTGSRIAEVNDGIEKDEYGEPLYGSHPKERVINLLKELRDGRV